MATEHWAAFVLAAGVLLVLPGPTVVLVVSQALGRGRRLAWPVVAGVALGDLSAMTASMLGLGAVLSASALLFTALRWAGGAYLVCLGIRLWRAPAVAVSAPAARPAGAGRLFAQAYAVTALNPKSIVFFVAFVPAFLDPARPFWPQVAILEATFVTLAALNATAYALLASSARQTLRRPAALRAANRVGGGLLMGAGVLAAGWRQA